MISSEATCSISTLVNFIPKEFFDTVVEDLIANPGGVDSNQFTETIRRFFLNYINLLKAIVAFLVMYLPIGIAEVAAGEGALQT